jgi:threonyl-tRNA synthetase
MLIIGDKEMEAHQVTVRLRNGDNLPAMSISEFAALIAGENETGRTGACNS